MVHSNIYAKTLSWFLVWCPHVQIVGGWMRVQLNLNMQLAEENLSGIALHLRHSCFAWSHCQNIIRWPPSRDYMWSSNVNHTQLDTIGCMRRIGSGGGTHSKHGVAEYVQRYTCFSYLLFKCISFSPFDIAFFFFFSFFFFFFFFFLVKRLDNNYLTAKFEVNADMNFLNFLIGKNISHLVKLAL